MTLTAKAMLLKITDRRIAGKLVEIIDGLRIDPDKQGAPLLDDLLGYRKLRAVGQRYRIIYTLDEETNTVLVVAVGIRKEGSKEDIYELARKLLRRGLLAPDNEDGDDVDNIKLR
ncbi:MAG: type II toxin-antitoxin system RelE/ParE family toxin [Chloroflexota bacterium]